MTHNEVIQKFYRTHRLKDKVFMSIGDFETVINHNAIIHVRGHSFKVYLYYSDENDYHAAINPKSGSLNACISYLKQIYVKND